MKNLSIKIIYICLSVLILSSCTVEKRVHMNGYHVNWNKSKSTKVDNHQLASAQEELNTKENEAKLCVSEIDKVDKNYENEYFTKVIENDNNISASITNENHDVKKLTVDQSLDDAYKYDFKEINYKDLISISKKKISPLKIKKNQDGGGDISAFAIAGFVCGILGLILVLTVGFPFLLGLLGAIFSAIGLRQTSNGKLGRGFAIAGLITGILAMIIFWLIVVLLASLFFGI